MTKQLLTAALLCLTLSAGAITTGTIETRLTELRAEQAQITANAQKAQQVFQESQQSSIYVAGQIKALEDWKTSDVTNTSVPITKKPDPQNVKPRRKQ